MGFSVSGSTGTAIRLIPRTARFLTMFTSVSVFFYRIFEWRDCLLREEKRPPVLRIRDILVFWYLLECGCGHFKCNSKSLIVISSNKSPINTVLYFHYVFTLNAGKMENAIAHQRDILEITRVFIIHLSKIWVLSRDPVPLNSRLGKRPPWRRLSKAWCRRDCPGPWRWAPSPRYSLREKLK